MRPRAEGSRLGLALALLIAACAPAPSSAPSAQATVAPSPTVGPSSPAPASRTPGPTAEPPDVALETVVDDLVSPLSLLVAPGDERRLFIVEQTGRIDIVEDGRLLPSPFLDISDRLVRLDTEYDERGLLGLAFHPDFAANGRFFVYYSTPAPPGAPEPVDHTDRLSEFRVGLDADAADPGSETVILAFEQPQPNHSGGALGFGPDGFLYLGTGDGGGRGDADPGHSPQGNAQDLTRLNGKVLRLDVDAGGDAPYAIPPDNPFAVRGGRPEIFAYGFRNPWRLSWEPAGDRRLLVSDVGYGRYEEVDVVVPGANYGWRIREGAHCLDVANPLADLADCPDAGEDGRPLVDPVVEYGHREIGIAVVGGYVYRGGAIPALQGEYVFGDYTADWFTPEPDPHGSLLAAIPDETAPWDWRRLVIADDALDHRFVTGMGEDAAGELYVLGRRVSGPTGRTGFVLRIVPVS
jgi:glucose/arabinose dehydrogenase